MQLIIPTPHLEVTPGTAVVVEVIVWNDTDRPARFRIRPLGIEDAWNAPPQLTPELAPDERHVVRFDVTLPVGFPAGHHICAIEGEPADADPRRDDDIEPVLAECTLAVGDLDRVSVQLEPARLNDRGKAKLRIRNRASEPVELGFTAESAGDRVRIRFRPDTVTVRAGDERLVDVRARGRRHLFGRPRQYAFSITAQGRTEPIHLTGSLQRLAILRASIMRIAAIIAVIALWGAGLAVGVDWLRDRAPSNQSLLEQLDEQRGDNGGDGTAAPDQGDGGGDTTGDGTGTAGADAPGTVYTTVGGVVGGPDPVGIQVSLRPIVPGQADKAATGGGAVLAFTGRAGKVFGPVSPAVSFLRDRKLTMITGAGDVTDGDGLWAITDVRGPAFYELRFAKPGYQTLARIIEITEEGEPVRVDVSMEAGTGRAAGTVVDRPGHGLRGVAITVGDGTVEAKTVTGADGRWSVAGLSTPGTFTVTAERDGYSTQFASFELGAGGSVDGIDLTMRAGVGTIGGVVSSLRTHYLDTHDTTAIVGAAVSITDGGDISQESATDDQGHYDFSDLPLGRSYTVTFSAPDHLTQVQSVVLESNVPDLDAALSADSGRVEGTVLDEAGVPIEGGVGVTLLSGQETYKTVTGAGGKFTFVDVAFGDYTAKFEFFGYNDGFLAVNVVPSNDPLVLDPVRLQPFDATLRFPATGTISGHAFLAIEPDLDIADLDVFLNGVLQLDPEKLAAAGKTGDALTDAERQLYKLQTSADGSFRIEHLEVGTYLLELEDNTDTPAYAPYSQPVNVAEGVLTPVEAGLRRLAAARGVVRGILASNRNGGLKPLGGITVCIVPVEVGPLYEGPNPRVGCEQDALYMASTSLDGYYNIESIRPGTYKVIYESTQDEGGTVRPYRWRPLIRDFSALAGSSNEGLDAVLELYPVVNITVLTPKPGVLNDPGTLADYDAVDGATVTVANSTANGVLVDLDPSLDPTSVAETSVTTDANGKVQIQLLSTETNFAIDAVPPVADDLQPRTASLTIVAGDVADLAIPLVTSMGVTGSFAYPYPTAASPLGTLPADGLAVTLNGVFDIQPVSGTDGSGPVPDPDAAIDVTDETRTDANGNFTFSLGDKLPADIPAGGEVTLEVGAGSSASATTVNDLAFDLYTKANIDIPQTEDLTGLPLVPVADGTVTGSFGFGNNRGDSPTLPTPSIELHRTWQTAPASLVGTQTSSPYSFTGVATGEYRVDFSADGYLPRSSATLGIEAVDDDRTASATLYRGATVNVSLTNVSGVLTTVELMDPTCTTTIDSQTTTVDGTVSFSPLDTGGIAVTYCAKASRTIAGQSDSDNGTTTVRDDQVYLPSDITPLSGTVSLTLTTPSRFSGTVYSRRASYTPGGSTTPRTIDERLNGATVSGRLTSTSASTVFSVPSGTVGGVDGIYSSPDLLPGTDYYLRAEATNHTTVNTGPFDFVPASEAAQDFVLTADKPTVTLQALNTDGDPIDISTYTVTATLKYAGTTDAITPSSSSGSTFTFTNLDPTVYELTMTATAHTQIPGSASTVTVAGQSVNVTLPILTVQPASGTTAATATAGNVAVVLPTLELLEANLYNINAEATGNGVVAVRYGGGACGTAGTVCDSTDLTGPISVTATQSPAGSYGSASYTVDLSDGSWGTSTTDPNGSDKVDDTLPAGGYEFTASGTLYDTAVTSPAVTSISADTAIADLVLVPKARNVDITVRDTGGGLVRSKDVTLTPDTTDGRPGTGSPVTDKTNNDGVANFTNVRPGDYKVTVQGSAVAAVTLPAGDAPASQPDVMALALGTTTANVGVTAAATNYDIDGKAVRAGTTIGERFAVSVTGATTSSFNTGNDGTFTVRLNIGTNTMAFSRTDYDTKTIVVQVAAGGLFTIDDDGAGPHLPVPATRIDVEVQPTPRPVQINFSLATGTFPTDFTATLTGTGAVSGTNYSNIADDADDGVIKQTVAPGTYTITTSAGGTIDNNQLTVDVGSSTVTVSRTITPALTALTINFSLATGSFPTDFTATLTGTGANAGTDYATIADAADNGVINQNVKPGTYTITTSIGGTIDNDAITVPVAATSTQARTITPPTVQVTLNFSVSGGSIPADFTATLTGTGTASGTNYTNVADEAGDNGIVIVDAKPGTYTLSTSVGGTVSPPSITVAVGAGTFTDSPVITP